MYNISYTTVCYKDNPGPEGKKTIYDPVTILGCKLEHNE